MPTADLLPRFGLFVKRQFFDAGLCAEIRRQTLMAHGTDAAVIRHGVPVINRESRRTTSVQILPSIISTVQSALEDIRPELEQHFGLSLTACDVPQFLLYKEGDYFKPHRDRTDAVDAPESLRSRKISVVIILSPNNNSSDGDSYRGGTLTFYRLLPDPTWSTCRTPLIEEEGLLVAFPAETFHEVTPLKRERVSVVSWFH